MRLSAEQLARNQVLFREVNERVHEIGELWRDGRMEFLCECSQMDCAETITLAEKEYERVRSSSNLFIVVPGHELPEIEQVTERHDGYVLVEKINGAEFAVRTDPRTRDPRP